jgi:DNA-binding CsgD family transcriptional regulator/tetratricopeptide (TPR) repeat protein
MPKEPAWTPGRAASGSKTAFSTAGWQDGHPTMATRMTSARFVGRAGELAELEAALHDAADRRASLALIAGESGVGKSRLVEELVGGARESGALVLSGDCVELGEDELPYAPLVAALRPLVRDEHPALDALPDPLRSALADMLPGFGDRPAREEAFQASVFEALLTLLETLSEERAVLLVIEDLHWADSSTRSFLSFLSRTICGERLMLAATYRSDELHRRHPLRPLLAELTRHPAARLVELPPFTREELAEQLESILAAPPDPGLVERIWARSEGNPLFSEEILATGLDGRGPLPPTLSDALMLRVERLSAPAQEVLRWLACQTSVDHELLAAVSGLEATELRDALREAMASHILVTNAHGDYSFRHALLREVVYDDLLPGERTELHSVLARALEKRIEAGDAGAHITAQAAHHWMAAGDQSAALAAAVRAAAAAERVDAYAEAHALLERALGLWERVQGPDALVGSTRVELLLRAAHAADLAQESARFEALLRGALELVDPEQEPQRAATMLASLHRAQWDLNRQDESMQTLDRALALLEPFEDTSERAELLARKARARMLQSRNREAIEAGREALQMARSVGDRSAEILALNAIGVALTAARQVDDGITALREALALAREHGFLGHASRTSVNLADVLHLAARSEEALAVAREGLAEARANKRPATWLALIVAEIEFDTGNWRAAAAAMPAERRRYWGSTLLDLCMRRIEQALGRGDDATARTELDVAARVAVDSTEPQFLAPLGAHRAELERRAGDVAAARTAVDEGLDRIEFCSDDLSRIAQVALAGVVVEADEAERARDRQDAAAEGPARERAAAMAERVELAAADGGPVVQAMKALAEAELARAEGRHDGALWERAAAAWDGIGRPYNAAYARWRQAEALARARDREGAERAAGAALEPALRLGSRWLAAEVEGLVARARLQLEGAEREAGPVVADAEDPFGLTARERQVLALVASGATNREVGERLHMAEKTASVHVSRILAKLDVRSRTEAAAVAHRLGLADTQAPV